MKIIYLADIHGAFARVKELLAATDAQVYIISGDLIDMPFYTEEMAAGYRSLQSRLALLQYRFNSGDSGIDEFVEELLRRKDIPADIHADVLEYRDATVRARRVLQQKYKVLESILSLKGNSQVFCLPGNYDMDLQYTSLHGRDLHRHWHHAAELRIAGYGGADIATPGIPQKYCVPYRADRGRREMSRFFAETRPDIIATHKPAHGIHDHVAPMGESGSPELRNFCEDNKVSLCLTGHIHDQWGFKEIDGTIYLNPSNFGEVHRPGGTVAEGGFYYSIEFQDRKVSTVTLCKLVRSEVLDVVAYHPRNGRWVETIIDSERFGALLRGKSHDREGDTGFSIRREMIRNMKWFFPGVAERHSINEITEKAGQAAFEVEKQYGVSLSLDFLGDFGREENQKPSGGNLPLDAVLYVRHSQAWPAAREKHAGSLPPGVTRIIRDVTEKCPQIRIIDCIDLDEIERALREKDYECYAALLFAAYRAFGQTLAEGDALSVEEMFNSSRAFQGEIEGTGWAYMEIFRNVAVRVENMKLFEARLRELGITAPEAFKRKIREFLHGSVEAEYKKAD